MEFSVKTMSRVKFIKVTSKAVGRGLFLLGRRVKAIISMEITVERIERDHPRGNKFMEEKDFIEKAVRVGGWIIAKRNTHIRVSSRDMTEDKNGVTRIIVSKVKISSFYFANNCTQILMCLKA